MISPIKRCKKKSTFIGDSLLFDGKQFNENIPQKDTTAHQQQEKDKTLVTFLKSLDFNKTNLLHKKKKRRKKQDS